MWWNRREDERTFQHDLDVSTFTIIFSNDVNYSFCEKEMDTYFRRFGLDIARLSLDLGQSLDESLPGCFDELRPSHVRQLMEISDTQSLQYSVLRSTLAPRDLLNQNDHLRSRIWRFTEFRHSETVPETIFRALILREDKDVLFNEDDGLVVCQPKINPGAFRGASCFLQFPKPGDLILHSQNSFPTTKKDLAGLENVIMKENNVSAVRSVLGLYLDAGDVVPSADWIVDADDMDPGHVTLAVANEQGLEAESPRAMLEKVRIPSLESLPWKRDANLLVLKAEAEWRDDFLPNDDRWSNIVCVLNMVMLYGDMDDFFTVWSIHDMIHRSTVSTNAMHVHRDVVLPLQRIFDVLRSFERSDRHDINDPARPLYQAIADVRTLISW